MKTIALIDDNWGGHHPTYFKYFTKTLLDLNYQVLTFCPCPEDVSEWFKHDYLSIRTNLNTFKINSPQPGYFRVPRFNQLFFVLHRWQLAAKAIHFSFLTTGILPDLVFFTWLDSYLSPYLTHYLIDCFFPYYWSGLCFQPHTFYIKPKKFSLARYRPFNNQAILRSPRCKAFGILDERECAKLHTILPNKDIIPFPDFTEETLPSRETELVRKLRYEAHGRKVIGLLGSMEKRKGLLTLLNIAQIVKEKDWFFVFVGRLAISTFTGKQLEYIKSIIKSNPKNCFFHFERIPEESEFNAVINECDLLFAAYENFKHSSNLLTKSAIFKKPIIVSKGFCMAKRVESFSLGTTVLEGDVNAMIEAIHSLLCQKETSFYGYENYKNRHSIRKLKDAFEFIVGQYG